MLTDILESSRKILNYTQGLSFDDFICDDKTLDAVVRNFPTLIKEITQLIKLNQ